MAVVMATLLIQSGDNEANVFLISMSWSAEQSRGGDSPLSAPPLREGSLERESV